MKAVVFEIYDALKSVGVPDEKSQSVTRAMDQHSSLTRGDIRGIEKELVRIDKELIVIKWMLGIVIAAVVLPLFKGFM